MLDEKALEALRLRREVIITPTWRVVVKELTTAEIMQSLNLENYQEDTSLTAFMQQVELYLPRCLEGATIEQLRELPPSKLKEIWIAFKECNSVFFDLAQTLGLGALGGRLKSAFVNDFLLTYVSSKRLGTLTPSGTDTPSS